MKYICCTFAVLVLLQGILPMISAEVPEASDPEIREPEKRQLVTGLLSAALPSLSNLLLKETHLDAFIGKAVGFVTSFFKGQSGDMPLEGSQLKLHYNVHHCSLHFGKRFLASKKCKAEVSEAHTKTSESCTESSQEKALKCAVKKEVQKLEALAKAVVAQQQAAHPAKRQLVTGLLSAALPSLTNLLLKETHLDAFIGKAVGFVTSFFKGQSGDMPLEGSQLKLHYNVHHCSLHFGKRFLASKRCKAEVSEAHTKTSESCTESSQEKALKCAVKKEVQKLEALAKAVVAQQQAAHPAKRQLVTGLLSAALPSLTNLLLKETHLDAFIGKAVGFVTSFFKGQSGDMPLEGSQLKLHYNVHHCSLHFGKRFLASKRCKAEVSEAHTKTSESCTESSQEKALKCAVKKEVQKLEALAKAVVAQQQAAHPAKRQLVTGLLSAALPSLTNLLLKETHLDAFIGKAVGFVTSFFKGQSGDMPLEGSQLKLHYNVHHCTLHFGKRFLASKRCKADVSEAHTKTSESCTESSQEKALKCAVKKEVQKLEALAKAVVAQQQAGGRR